MRRKFSERHGFRNPRELFQIESIDDGLKNRLWNIIKNSFIDTLSAKYDNDSYIPHLNGDKRFIVDIYDKFFKDNVDPLVYSRGKIREDLKKRYSNLQWFEIYDLIEFIIEIHHAAPNDFYMKVNQILEDEMSGYRFVDSYIAPIIDVLEIEEIEEALDIEYYGAKRHLSNALDFLSDRENPDYQNSIKESITAVEAVAKSITGKDTDLSKCLKSMDLGLNKQFKTAMDNMYGWTCKEDGIRHGHTGEELKTSFEEAKYMLVTCSAFVNYMIAKKGIK